MTVLPGGWLQLAFDKTLQMGQALRLTEQRFQGLGFA
ncbi:hypothetical protein N878_12750 [Pseudomonas sp. EGD-AK9]|nr:hypothetical protein N878_12750 [Pseudomonas sp. EGD-AK9]